MPTCPNAARALALAIAWPLAAACSGPDPVSGLEPEAREASLDGAVAAMQRDPPDAAVALRELARAFDAGYPAPSRALVEPALQPLRDDPAHRSAFRRLLRDHARESRATIATAGEPGPRLRLRARLLDFDGAPAKGALVYLEHADRTGRYAPEAAEPGGGADDARLFAALRADRDGVIAVDTILPGGYGGAPPHFHVGIRLPAAGGGTRGRSGGSLYFDGGWPVHPEIRSDAQAGVAWLVPAERLDDGSYRCDAELQLRPR